MAYKKRVKPTFIRLHYLATRFDHQTFIKIKNEDIQVCYFLIFNSTIDEIVYLSF